MTLLFTTIFAVASTIIWYMTADKNLKLDTLALIYWGATLMWLVDAIAEYIKIGYEYFTPTLSEMLNDSFLGLSAGVLGLIIWLAVFLISDPKNVLKKQMLYKHK